MFIFYYFERKRSACISSEYSGVKGVIAITLFTKYLAIRHLAINSITSFNSITSELAKVQFFISC